MEIWCETTLMLVGIIETILIGAAIILFAEYVNRYKKLEKELKKYKGRKEKKKTR
jgi:uncharacterized membrane-anchored protein YhcB (DUF1043 family)